MKILLINPPKSSVNLIAQYAPDDLREKIGKIGLIGPPHSLCAIAGNLPDFDVEILDMKAEYDLGLKTSPEDFIKEKIISFNPDIAASTVITSDYNNAIGIMKTVKQINSEILTIVGGIHPSLCPEDFNLPYIDIIMQGPGKKLFREIVLSYRNKKGFSQIPNIILNEQNNLIYTKKVNLFNDRKNLLSNIFANRKLVEKYSDAYKAGMDHRPMAFIETSLGCSARCNFCAIWPMNNGQYYVRDVEDVISELKSIKNDVIRFVDANTMGDEKYCNLLFDRIIEEGINKVIVMDVRADTAANNPKLIEKAARAGLKAAIVGVESFNDEELLFYNKGTSQDVVHRSIEVFNRYDIHIRGVCMVQPDYDYEDFYKLTNFLDKNGLQYSAFTIMTAIPGTQLYSELKEKIIIKDLDYYNYFNSIFETKLEEQEFYRLTAELFRNRRVRV